LQIVSFTTDYQRMDVYDVLRPGVQSSDLYRRSLSNDGSYESMNPELFAPDRIVFLDGRSQNLNILHSNKQKMLQNFAI
jgi:hypothetical protein